MPAEQRQRIGMHRPIAARKGRTADQQTHPARIHQPRHRPPGQPQDIGVVPIGMQTESSQFQHRARIGRKCGQIIKLRRIAFPDPRRLRQMQQPIAANQLSLIHI